MRKSLLTIILLLFSAGLVGCEGISRGVTEAVLNQKSEDSRQCHIYGPPLAGVRASLDAQRPNSNMHITKILMVHGVGKHLPGYSNQLKDKLMQTLGLDVVSAETREIMLYDSSLPSSVNKYNALLRITRHTTPDRTRELLFYEL